MCWHLKYLRAFFLATLFIFIVLNILPYYNDTLDYNEFRSAKNQTNPHNFKLVLNPGHSTCGLDKSKKLTLIAIVLIAPNAFEQRNKIRQTWGRFEFNGKFKLVFALGLSKHIKINNQIEKEFKLYKDIVQEDFTDSYQNLTIKAIMSFKWISKYCSNSYFALRINDDVVVNTHRLMSYLEELIRNNSEQYLTNKIIGFGYFNTSPIRQPSSKFYISNQVFNQTYYDDYCEGSAYLITSDLSKMIYEYSLNFSYPPFSTWLEDVYIGMITKRLNTTIVDISKTFQPKNQYAGFTLKYKLTLIDNDTIFVYDANMATVWNALRIKKK